MPQNSVKMISNLELTPKLTAMWEEDSTQGLTYLTTHLPFLKN